jgi:hypothetical protein
VADKPKSAPPMPMPQPHRVPWFWRLMGLFQRQSHPIPIYADDMASPDERKATEWWNDYFRLAHDRRERYRIFDEMDTFGLITSILDVYAEETTQPDYDKGVSTWIEAKNQTLVQRGNECLRNCQVEDRVTPLTRRTAKYGDAMQRLIYKTGKGVMGWRSAEAKSVHRLEDKYCRLIGFKEDGKRFRGDLARNTSWPWDYIHFRLLGKDDNSMYGTSILEAMFRSWRQLTLMEDAILLYRVRRGPDRNVIYVDVGNMEDHEAMEYVNEWRKRFRKMEFIDPASPDYKKQYNPLTPLEDIFLPQRPGETTSRVETLSGAGDVGNVYDLNYYTNAFFGAAKAPKAYFGFEGEINAKATLMQQDVRFARTCKRLRKSIVYGLRQLLDVHFTLLPTDASDKSFDVSAPDNAYVIQMTPISYLDEFERLELIQLRYQVVEAMAGLAGSLQLDPKVWGMYILLHYAKLPEDVVQKLITKSTPVPVVPTEPGAPPPEGGEEGGEVPPEFGAETALTPREKKQILENYGPKVLRQITEPWGGAGIASLSKDDERRIAEAIHKSPKLRKVIGDIAEYCIEDESARQIDPSLLPPSSGGAVIEDTFKDDDAARQLKEDLDKIKGKK